MGYLCISKKIKYMYKPILALSFVWIGCQSNSISNTNLPKDIGPENKMETIAINPKALTIQERFATPAGFIRISEADNSLATFMRKLPLKEWGSVVKYYNGAQKLQPNVYCSVIVLPIGTKDLHQCADAVMNLWANYLYSQKKYNDIQFKFLNDAAWHNFAIWSGGIYSKEKFTKYMEQVWSAANTRSLFGQLKSVTITAAKIGDVLIQTGKPYGHAIMIVDECANIKTGNKMYMLAQSYMPAQETQILINPNDSTNSPWYSFNESTDIITPEWNFTINDLRRF
jgi:hypothetical protein